MLKIPNKPAALFSKRLGVAGSEKPRPLKLFFDSPDTVKTIFSNHSIFNGKKLKIKNDSTPREMEYLKQLRVKLQERIDNGEKNLTIKFVNGVPSIITKKNE